MEANLDIQILEVEDPVPIQIFEDPVPIEILEDTLPIQVPEDPVPVNITEDPVPVQIMEDPVPPPPARKKRATKRGLCNKVRANAEASEDQPQVLSRHITDVYSNCVQRTMFSLKSSDLNRRPLFSKQMDSNLNSEQPPKPDVAEPPACLRPKRKAQAKAASLSTEEPAQPAISIEDDDLDGNENSTSEDVSLVRSPSPPVPPPPPTNVVPKRRRYSKSIQDAFKAISSIRGELEKGQQASPKSSVLVPDSPEVPQSSTQVVRVRHIDDVHRFSMAKEDMFYSLQVRMGELLGVRADQVGLYLNESRLEPSDTPLSRKLHLADFIVCHILVDQEGAKAEEDTAGPGCIRVQMQCRNSRRKTSMVIKKFLPLRVLMERYAQKHEQPLDRLQFYFDGDLLTPDTMPADVELDDDDTIDVVEKK